MLVECMILTIVEGIVTLSTPRFIKLLLLIVLLCCLPADCKLLLSVANGGTTTSSLALDVSAVKDASMIAASSSIWFLCFGGAIMFLLYRYNMCMQGYEKSKDSARFLS